MKPVKFAKSFEKSYVKRIARNGKRKKAFDERYKLFVAGERGVPLNDHALVGSMLGKRSFSIAGDIRVIYQEESDHYLFLDIGTHAQVYDV